MKKRFNRNNFGGKIPQGPKNIGLVLVVFLSLIALTQLTDYSRSVSHISHSQFLKELEANLTNKIEKLELTLTIKFGGLLVIAVGVLAAIIKL